MRKDWEVKKLGDVAISDLGKTLNKSKDTGVLLPYLCSINVQWNKIDLSTQKEALFEDSEINKYSVKKGDLLVCEGGDIGRAAIWNEDYSMLYQNALHRMRFNKNIIAEYVLYFLWRLKRRGVLDKRYAKGVTIKHLVKSSLLSINIPVPPLQTQQLIVEEFDCLISIIEKQKKQLEELDNLAQSIFYDMFGDPIENEKGWNFYQLGKFAQLINGRAYKQDELLSQGKYPVLRVGNLFSNSKFYYSNLELSEDKYCNNNDLLYAWSASFGAYIWHGNKVIYHYHIWKIVLNELLANNIFICYLLNIATKYMNSSLHGVAMMHLTKSGMEQTSFILPPLPLQQQFAAKIEAIEKQKELIKKSIKETEDLFNGRMDYYFN